MQARNFPHALKKMMDALHVNQQQFADAVDISQSMVTKLLKGEPARHTTYSKVFKYAQRMDKNDGVPTGESCFRSLRDAFYKDIDEQYGWVDESSSGLGSSRHTNADRLVQSLFRNISDPVCFALFAIGAAADKNDNICNLLMSLAESCRDAEPSVGSLFPSGYFSQSLQKPSKGRVLLGGSMGEIALARNLVSDGDSEDQIEADRDEPTS